MVVGAAGVSTVAAANPVGVVHSYEDAGVTILIPSMVGTNATEVRKQLALVQFTIVQMPVKS